MSIKSSNIIQFFNDLDPQVCLKESSNSFRQILINLHESTPSKGGRFGGDPRSTLTPTQFGLPRRYVCWFKIVSQYWNYLEKQWDQYWENTGPDWNDVRTILSFTCDHFTVLDAARNFI